MMTDRTRYRKLGPLLVSVFEQSPNPVGLIQEGRYLDCNAAMAKMFGLSSSEELIGTMAGTVLSPEKQPDGSLSVESGRDMLRQCLEEGEVTTTWVPRRKNGELFEVSIQLRRLDGTDPPVIIMYVQDITEESVIRQRLKESEQRFGELAAHAPVGIFIGDAAGNCMYANRKTQEICGVNKDEMMDFGWARHLHPDDRDLVFSRWRSFTEGDHPFAVEFRFQHESGEDIWVAGSAVPFTSSPGEPRSFLGTITDISEIKRIESRIEESRNEALEANNAKSEFLSRMSHELRTPMNAILGFGQLLQMNHPDMPADQREGVNQILSGGEHLLELIEDILDFSRMESGHITLRIGRVKTRRVLQRSLALLTPLAAQVGVKVVLKDEEIPDVIADPHRLQQVLVNLLSNAIKYNSRGGRVDIHAEPNTGNKLRIHVIDTGEGIHEMDRIRLFKPFERISKSNPMVEGTGIGLSLSKELVELMGGSIDFSSEPGRGTDFWIDVPAASDGHTLPEQAESPVPQIGSPPPKGLKILYIEDHLASIELMMEVAREFEECEFHTATNAPDGIALAKVTPPDLILMDINLPGMDGIEALRLLKSDHRTRDIPVIALSASALSEVVEDGMEAGFSRFLVKPLKLERLFEAIISETSSRKPPKKTGPR